MAIYIFYHPDDGETFARTLHFDLKAHVGIAAPMSDGADVDHVLGGDLVLIVQTPFAGGSSFIAHGIATAKERGAHVHWISADDHGLTQARHLAEAHTEAAKKSTRPPSVIGGLLEQEMEAGGEDDEVIDHDEAIDHDRSGGSAIADLLREEAEPPAPSPSLPALRPQPISPVTPPATIAPQPMPSVPPGGRPDPKPDAGVASQTAEPIQFSAYYPVEVKPDDWQPLRAYVFKDGAAKDVERDVQRELGSLLDRARRVVESARGKITEGALISAEPQLDGFQFNPPSASVAFFEDWHRFDFKLRAKTAPPFAAVNGRITFRVEGIIVADLPLSIFVSPQAGATLSAGLTASAAKPYRAIFCSYSHRDTPIILRVEKVIKALGDDFLRDATTLRSGEDWNAGLLDMIDRADIFQLFWSTSASASKYVRQEWEYALARMRDQSLSAFIRPVYWEEPMPPPPPELGFIHFAHDPTLDD